MEPSDAVRDAIQAFYERFSAGDADAFAAGVPDEQALQPAPGS